MTEKAPGKKTIFRALFGSYVFGFAKPNSDYDVVGVYVEPATKFLGLSPQVKQETNHKDPIHNIETSMDEIGKYLQLISRGQGSRLEWINSPIIIEPSRQFNALKDLVNSAGLSKSISRYYSSRAQNYFNKKSQEPLKNYLHAFRYLMTGIFLFEKGKVILNLNRLNTYFNIPLVETMIGARKADESLEISIEEIRRSLGKLDGRLANATKTSTFRETVDTKRLDDFLISLRREN